MIQYALGFYRIRSAFSEATMRGVLKGLHSLGMGFFPATLSLSESDALVLASPEDYKRAVLPNGYYIDTSTATIPLDASNSVEVIFTESRDPTLVPASLVCRMTDETIRTNGWNLEAVARMCRVVICSFEPDYGYLFDELHSRRPEYVGRMFKFDRLKVPSGLYWINYYGPSWVRNVGMARLERLRPMVPLWERLETGGVLFALQSALYDETAPGHQEVQRRMEDLFGLAELQAGFPNPGL